MTIRNNNEKYVTNSAAAFKFYDLDKGAKLTEDFSQSYSIIFVKSGLISLEFEENDDSTPKFKQKIILIPIGTKYSIITYSKTQLLIYKFNYRNFYQIQTPLQTLTKEIVPVPPQYYQLPLIDAFDAYLIQLISLRNDGIELMHDSVMYQIKQYEFFILLEHHFTRHEQAAFLYPLLDKELDFEEQIQMYHLKAEKVPDLARLCGYSTREFTRKFYRLYNIPPYQWMLQKRAEAIKKELTGDTLIKDIVYKYNFSSPSHFTHFCRKYLGDTPGQVREKMHQQIKHYKHTTQ